MPERSAGDLAIVLHSHMPYVEGFGTYPFGEEWLFDAVIRSYLPVLEVARDLTMTVTPVLADQLEDAGMQGRLRDFLVEWRVGAAEADLAEVPEECRAACEAELARYRRALELLDAAGGDPLLPFQQAAAEGRVALAASAATHAVLPLLATRQGLAPPARRRAALAPPPVRLGRRLLAARVRLRPRARVAARRAWGAWFCVDQSAHGPSLDALAPVPTAAGPVALPIDWEAIEWLWSLDGYPSDPAHAQFAGKSLRGMRIWKVGGGAYDPAAAEAAARRQAGEFLEAAAARLRAYADERDRRGLLVFAIDTELLGHWWSEGPIWLSAVLEGAEAAGVRLLSIPRALELHEPVDAAAAPLQLGGGEGPPNLGLAPGRRPRLGGAAVGVAAAEGARRRPARRRGDLRRPRASGRPGQRLGLPRPPRGGGRLRVPAGDRPRSRGAGGHRLPLRHRSPYAIPRPGPEHRSPAGALIFRE